MISTARGAAAAVLAPAWAYAPHLWQFTKFALVGASGYAVNLSVFAFAVHGVGSPYLAAATASFCVAAFSNYVLNRRWTFGEYRRGFARQGVRFLVVSVFALSANLAFLDLLVVGGLDPIPAQLLAIVLVTPLSFLGNKLWTFRVGESPSEGTGDARVGVATKGRRS